MKMLRLLGAACAAACALALSLPALAQSDPVAASPIATTIIDFAPLVNSVLVPLAIGLLTVLGTWVLTKAKTWLGLQNNSEAAKTLETAMQNALAFAQSKIPNLTPATLTLDTKSALLATAANYVLAHTPDAMKLLGVDQAGLIQKLEARLSVNTTPAAQSVAVPTDPAAVRS